MSKTKAQSSPPLARYGAYLGLAVAVIAVGYAIRSFAQGADTPTPQKLAYVIIGTLQAVLCGYTLLRSRTAWSFAVALNGTLTVVFFFGAPKVRDAFEASMVLGVLPCLVFAAVTALLAMDPPEEPRSPAES